MKIRYLVLFTALVLSIGTAGCGGSSNASSSGSPGPTLGPGPATTVITIPNNNFATPGVGGQGSQSHQYGPQNASWTFVPLTWAGTVPSGSGVAACPGDGFTPYDPNPPGGAQIAFIQGGGTIAQTVSQFQAGIRYIVRFYAIQRLNNHQTFRVSLDGATLADFTPPNDTTFTLMSTPSFTTTSGTHTLQFTGLNPNSGDNSAFIDLVSIVPVGSTNTIALQNTTTNQIALWSVWDFDVNGTATVPQVPSANLKIVGLADINQDGKPDLVFQDQTTGKVIVWFLNGSAVTTTGAISTTPPSGWHVVGVSDFNDDGWPDLLLAQQGTGNLVLWYLHGLSVTGQASVSSPLPASTAVAGTGYFSDVTPFDSPWQATGKSDILLQNTSTGQLTVWHMNGPTLVSSVTVTTAPASNQSVNAVAYVSGHTEPDILMTQPGSAQITEWHFDGGQAGGNGNYFGTLDTPLPPGWSIAGPR